MTRPIFVVGAQRSGTTAFAHILSTTLAAQRDGLFTVNGKLLYFLKRWTLAGDLEARHFRADEIIHALLRRPAQGVEAEAWLVQAERALRDAARKVAAGYYPANKVGVDALIHDVTAGSYGDKPWGDKYNEYLLDLDFIVRLYPEAKWIFLYRHPVEVAASMLRWTGDRPWRPDRLEDCEAKWVAWNTRWLEFRDRVAGEHRLEVSYEDLCSGAPNARFDRFLGLSLEENLRTTFRRRSPASPLSPATDVAQRCWDALQGLRQE